MSATTFLLLLLSLMLHSLVAHASNSGIYLDNHGDGTTVLIDTLSKRQQRLIKEEMLHVLGLEKEPKVNKNKGTLPPQYMLDLYKKFANEAEKDVSDMNSRYKQRQNSQKPDLVIGFVNHVRKHPLKGQQRHEKSRLFYFDFSEVPATEAMCQADFRVYKESVEGHRGNRLGGEGEDEEGEVMRFIVHRLVKDSLDEEPHFEVEANMTVRESFDGWLDFNITSAATQWTYFPNTNLGLYMEILDGEGHEVSARAAGLVGRRGAAELQPFLVAYFRSSPVPPAPLHRTRRATAATDSDPVQPAPRNRHARATARNDVSYIDNPMIKYMPKRESCNKRALYVSFKDLNWQAWIISPKGYAAFYCQGHCRFPLNSHMNATNHAIVQTLLHTKRTSIPEPCCAATKLSPLSVLYFDERNNVILKNYQNMVVKACGCH